MYSEQEGTRAGRVPCSRASVQRALGGSLLKIKVNLQGSLHVR